MKRSTAMKISKFVSRLLSTSVLLLLLTGCAPAESSQPEDSSKIRAVATIFPQYDFLRQIGGDHLELTMLLKPGSESHSFEPTPADMIAVSRSDLFVYVGGDSDAWVETILESVDTSGKEMRYADGLRGDGCRGGSGRNGNPRPCP